MGHNSSREEIEARLARTLGIQKDITEMMQTPDRARLFSGSKDWSAITEHLVTLRWEHLLLALDSQTFDEKEYQRGVCAGLQLALDAPGECLKEDK